MRRRYSSWIQRPCFRPLWCVLTSLDVIGAMHAPLSSSVTSSRRNHSPAPSRQTSGQRPFQYPLSRKPRHQHVLWIWSALNTLTGCSLHPSLPQWLRSLSGLVFRSFYSLRNIFAKGSSLRVCIALTSPQLAMFRQAVVRLNQAATAKGLSRTWSWGCSLMIVTSFI